MATYEIKVVQETTDGTTRTEEVVSMEDVVFTPMARHTTSEIDALTGMSGGNMVYDTDLSCCKVRAGGAWKNATSEAYDIDTNVIGSFTSPSLTWKMRKVGDRVDLIFPGVSGTTINGTSKLQMNGTLKASFRPSHNCEIPYVYYDGSANVTGKADIGTSGSVILGPISGNFPDATSLILKPIVFTWYV
jgi:hypothetical protein